MPLDFHRLCPRSGGNTEAFEELCCQLAARQLLPGTPFVRLRGAGGDGGVECFTDLPNSGRRGWQAKYVFSIGSLLTQAADSLNTALAVHPTLIEYVLCFPFDLTGPTARKGKSSQEKLQCWKTARERAARKGGRNLTIEVWPAAKLRQLLIDYDNSGGLRAFFFDETILTSRWFSDHFGQARHSAGPRYTPELNVKTPLWKWFAAFGRTSEWVSAFNAHIRACFNARAKLSSAVKKIRADTAVPPWPDELKQEAVTTLDESQVVLDTIAGLASVVDSQPLSAAIDRLHALLVMLEQLEARVYQKLEEKHGENRPDSPGFRQWMAEYQISFPMANLDRIRDFIGPLREFYAWLTSPAGELAFRRAFVLAGAAGSGKTHGICDAAEHRLHVGLLTCVLFGHQFQGEPDPWIRLRDSIGLPASLSMDGVLDALDAAGAASGHPLILFIDAINETRPLAYWREKIAAFAAAAERRAYVRLCFSCRSSFLPFSLPSAHDLMIANHAGFEGVEREACQAFFEYYGFLPPIAPILAPDFSNPLYLKLVCQTMKAKGLRQLPTGWHRLAPTISAFLAMKEQDYAEAYTTSTGARIVSRSLMAIARKMAGLNQPSLPWSLAQAAIAGANSALNPSDVLNWLIRADLLIEDASSRTDRLDAEAEVRLAFERLGDFLVAGELLERAGKFAIRTQGQPGGLLHELVADSDSIARSTGVLDAVAVLIPERLPGVELPDLFRGHSVHSQILRAAIRTLHLRDQATFTAATQQVIQDALALEGFEPEVFDAVIAISWQPSQVDALWLDSMLRCRPLVERDGFWCSYLHRRCESRSAVTRLITAAFELPLNDLDPTVADRWATTLFWFTASADRRVKDKATRAATHIMASVPTIIPNVLSRLIDCDDDEVRERLLVVTYSALLLSRDAPALRRALDVIHRAFQKHETYFDNALIRDDVHCIADLARKLGVIGMRDDLTWTIRPINGAWPLRLPIPEEVDRWSALLFVPDESSSDFYTYSMNCLRPWMHAVSKKHMAAWILQRVARDFGYEGSDAARFDEYMIEKFGAGRGRSSWAERIGKKYQWIAMYQLASRLQDHVERRRDEWTTEPQHPPLILLEERKIDPTMCRNPPSEAKPAAWWISSQADLDPANHLSDGAWCDRRTDVPTLKHLQSVVDKDSRQWRVLHAYVEWSTRRSDNNLAQHYRYVWAQIRSYLVLQKDLDTAFAALRVRNFIGDWMPVGSRRLYGFAGEYPWATAFNDDPDRRYRTGGSGNDLPIECHPTWNELNVEFEYDATKGPNFSFALPAPLLFTPNDLWWNGQNGFVRNDGKTVLFDPAVAESGPTSLLADTEDLQTRLRHGNSALLWIMYGEKRLIGQIAGRRKRQWPVKVFSQIASLDQSGTLRYGPFTLFEKDDKHTPPKPRKKKVAKKTSRKLKPVNTRTATQSAAPNETKKKATRTARSKTPRRRHAN